MSCPHCCSCTLWPELGRVRFWITAGGMKESKFRTTNYRWEKESAVMKSLLTSVMLLCLGALVWAKDEDKNAGELQRATEVIQNLTSTSPDQGVPNQVLEGAKCVAVIPKLVKGAFIVGGEHGTGVATCRTTNGSWSAPAPFSVSGVSWRAQIGGKSTHLVLFIMNDQGMNDLLQGHVKVGAD